MVIDPQFLPAGKVTGLQGIESQRFPGQNIRPAPQQGPVLSALHRREIRHDEDFIITVDIRIGKNQMTASGKKSRDGYEEK